MSGHNSSHVLVVGEKRMGLGIGHRALPSNDGRPVIREPNFRLQKNKEIVVTVE
jgi:hypothetical protein